MRLGKNELLEMLKNNPRIKVKQADLEKIKQLEDEKKNKYNAVPQRIDGIYFDSTAEANRYCELKLLVRAGVISDLKVHPRYSLTKKKKYEADFEYIEDGKSIVEDVKGKMTERSALAIETFKEKYPEYEFRLIK
jgi:hypothetical protein